MSVKRLDGWEPTETHTHTYEGDRVVSTIVSREVEWDEAERGLMLALTLYEAQLCPAGHWLPDASAAVNEERYSGVSTRCHACTAAAQEVTRLKDNPHPTALLFGANLRRE